MCCVIVDGLDLRKSGEMVGFGVELNAGFRGGRDVPYTDTVLDEPLVDGLGRMRHEDTAFEICLRKDIG